MADLLLEELLKDYDEGVEQTEKRPKKYKAKERITPSDIVLLYFLSKFSCSDENVLSIVRRAKKTNFGDNTGLCPSPDSTDKRLRKLVKLGAVNRYKTTGGNVYGITSAGLGYVNAFSQNPIGLNKIDGISLSRTDHFRYIALTAAMFCSPLGYMKEHGYKPCEIEDLYDENFIRKSFEPLKKRGSDWGQNRLELSEKAKKMLSQKLITTKKELWETFPGGLTVAFPRRENNDEKTLAFPDLAVIAERLDGRTERLWVEIELSCKALIDYEQQVELIARELKNGLFYDRVIYFTHRKRVEKLLKIADYNMNTGLFESGKLLCLPLKNIDGTVIEPKERIKL